MYDIYKVNAIIKSLKEEKIMVSKSSFLRWEKVGKIPKLKRSPGGWRYADQELLDKIISTLKN